MKLNFYKALYLESKEDLWCYSWSDLTEYQYMRSDNLMMRLFLNHILKYLDNSIYMNIFIGSAI